MTDLEAYRQAFADIRALKDGPTKKFQLLKVFGGAIRKQCGHNPAMFSCANLERTIAALLEVAPC